VSSNPCRRKRLVVAAAVCRTSFARSRYCSAVNWGASIISSAIPLATRVKGKGCIPGSPLAAQPRAFPAPAVKGICYNCCRSRRRSNGPAASTHLSATRHGQADGERSFWFGSRIQRLLAAHRHAAVHEAEAVKVADGDHRRADRAQCGPHICISARYSGLVGALGASAILTEHAAVNSCLKGYDAPLDG
jgi:hypothetical protein